MLPKSRRITPRERVAYVLRKGPSLKGGLFFAKYLPKKEGPCRFAVVASLKVAKTAVQRNKVRRRMYESIRKNIHDTHTSCYDVAVITTARCLTANARELEHDVVNTLKRFL